MRQHLFPIFLLLLIAGCATRTPTTPPVKIDFRIQVNTQFDALPNGTRIDFQGGQRIQQGNLDKWTTYCRLYVYNRNHKADYLTAVLPGSFEVTKVEAKYNSSDSPPGFYHSSFTWGVRDMPAYYLYQVHMRLTSPDQPDVQTLKCYKKWTIPRAKEYPTRDEIQQALGDLIEIIPLTNAGIDNDGTVTASNS
jgi:hypothetical protein